MAARAIRFHHHPVELHGPVELPGASGWPAECCLETYALTHQRYRRYFEIAICSLPLLVATTYWVTFCICRPCKGPSIASRIKHTAKIIRCGQLHVVAVNMSHAALPRLHLRPPVTSFTTTTTAFSRMVGIVSRECGCHTRHIIGLLVPANEHFRPAIYQSIWPPFCVWSHQKTVMV